MIDNLCRCILFFILIAVIILSFSFPSVPSPTFVYVYISSGRSCRLFLYPLFGRTGGTRLGPVLRTRWHLVQTRRSLHHGTQSITAL